MNNRRILEELHHYFKTTRQVGHTTAMLEGAKNSDCIVLVKNHEHRKLLERIHPGLKTTTLYSPNALRGQNKPLLIDNDTMVEILSMALHEIEVAENP